MDDRQCSLAESVIELLRAGKPFTQENLADTYVARRRAAGWKRAAREAEDARNGFHGGFVRGLIGMALAGLTGGKLHLTPRLPPAHKQIKRAQSAAGRVWNANARQTWFVEDGRPLHDALMTARGWPEIRVRREASCLAAGRAADGRQSAGDAGLRGSRGVSRRCGSASACDDKTCIAMCSGQAMTLGANNLPVFEREKCVHCGGVLVELRQIGRWGA